MIENLSLIKMKVFSVFIIGLFITLANTKTTERTEAWVFSDVHIGSYWFTYKNNTEGFYEFLTKYLATPDTPAHTLIINGDFIDLVEFMHPVDIMNSTAYKNFITINVKKYIDLLKKIRENNVRLIMISGNHDMTMEKKFYDAVGLDVELYPKYSEGNIHIEHGNLKEIVVSPDPANLVPVGYYAARAMAFSYGLLGEKWRKNPSFLVCELLADVGMLQAIKDNEYFYKMMMSYSLGDKWLTPVVHKYEEYKNSNFGRGCYYFDCIGEMNVTMETVVKKFRSTVNRWIEVYGEQEVWELFQTQCNNYDYYIQKSDKDLYILGHTHLAEFEVFQRNSDSNPIVYVNTGAWVDGATDYTFIRITRSPNIGSNATFVELAKFIYETKSIEKIQSSPIPYQKGNRNDIEVHTSRRRRKVKRTSDENREMLKEIIRRNQNNGSTKKAPPGWTCDPHFYDSNDGCDCLCGIWDPDCGEPKETCKHFC